MDGIRTIFLFRGEKPCGNRERGNTVIIVTHPMSNLHIIYETLGFSTELLGFYKETLMFSYLKGNYT